MSRFFWLSLLLLLFPLIPLPASGAHETTVSGVVTTGEHSPVAGIRVSAWPAGHPTLEGSPPFISKETGADGAYALTLPPGAYYFLAQGETLYGINGPPARVPEAGLRDLVIRLYRRNPPPATVAPRVLTGAQGRLTWKGEPVEGAVVTVYADLDRQLRGQGLGVTAPTGENGLFDVELPPGTYYLVARKRGEGDKGELRVGELYSYWPGNPLRLESGRVADVSMDMAEVPRAPGIPGAGVFATSIRGRVSDPQGQGVMGVQVLLYGSPETQTEPLFVSSPTSADGNFALSIPSGGEYWLVARSRPGGRPAAGSLFGRFKGTPDGAIRVETGQSAEGIEIRVNTVR